mgnify:FL=1|jgi:hypothetical protein
MTTSQDDFSIQIKQIDAWRAPEDQAGSGLVIHTSRGDIQAIAHHGEAGTATRGIVWVWGANGGFAGPADGIFNDLAEQFKPDITSIRINYRDPRVLHESVLDALVGVSFLAGTGHTEIALVGHSFGGAVVISAAPFSERVKAVVALSSQTMGATKAADVSPRPLLLVHGQEDIRLPPRCSELIYDWALEPKELKLYPEAGHGLMQCKDELREFLSGWLVDKLGA